jgi:exocyst complex protein 7
VSQKYDDIASVCHRFNSCCLQAEYDFLEDLAPLPNPSDLASAYTTLLTPLLTLFSNTISSLIALIKRSLHKYTFLALAAYDSMSALSSRWDTLLLRRGELGSRKENNELKEGLNSLRAVCLRSFPEFLADIKLSAMGKGAEWAGTGLAECTISVFSGSLPSLAYLT